MKSRILTIFFLLSLLNQSFASFIVSPTHGSISVDPADKKTPTTSFYIENGDKEPIAVDISLRKRTVDQNGEVIDSIPKDLSDRLSAYPKQFIVKPNEKRTVRVIFKGEKNISSEENYRIIIQRVPVTLTRHKKDKNKDKKAGVVELLVQYHGNLFVTPTSAKAELNLVSFEKKTVTNGKEKADGIQLNFQNKGTASFPIENYTAEIHYLNQKGENVEKTIKQQDIPVKNAFYDLSRVRVYKNSKQKIFLQLNEPIKEVKDVKIKFE